MTTSLPKNFGCAEHIRVRGLVQGVGFRPHVWRLAQSMQLQGDVRNDGDGVLIRLWSQSSPAVDDFCHRLSSACPPLARIDSITRTPCTAPPPPGFQIIASAATGVHIALVPDAATCSACATEILDPGDRRHRYPFTNCTHCGPRLSILQALPYDRANTSMVRFPMCPQCAAEYRNPADRRFHAQPNACPVCGPQLWLEDPQGHRLESADPIATASRRLAQGQILAIKGIGGFHLACDASHVGAVTRLRQAKTRAAKPLALMARDFDIMRRYCDLSDAEQALLATPAAPIVLLERHARALSNTALAPGIAPGQTHLGFMLPYSPLHQLLLADWERPLVMTSGNRGDEPQVIANDQARAQLAPLADALLLHDRDICNRLDDSLARVDLGQPRLLRRARGYAPAPLARPAGFEEVPEVLALGGQLKNTFCLLDQTRLLLSQHLGDLDEPATLRAFERTLALYQRLFEHHPAVIAIDAHPEYHSSRFGRDWAARDGLTLVEVQHHFAHIAAVLGDNGWPREAGSVLGLALDGLGYGTDGQLWGGELLRADYRGFQRLAWLRPTPLPGGDRAAREPWRNLVAQLHTSFGWELACSRWPGLPRATALTTRPVAALVQMMDQQVNAPLSSSTGRLFDAVAAALNLHPEHIAYEGQAAMELEAVARAHFRVDDDAGYPFAWRSVADGTVLDPTPMWQALLDDLTRGEAVGIMAARFHTGLARALVALAAELALAEGLDTLACSGGSFHNRLLLQAVSVQAGRLDLKMLSHRQVPSNDGGLALGQALIAAAQAA